VTDPTGGGSGGDQEIGRGHISIGVQDNTGAGLDSLNKRVNDSSANTRRQITNTAQTLRNSTALVTRAVGSNITNTVLEPIISIGESFLRSAEDAELSGTRMEKAFKMAQVGGAGLIGVGTSLMLLGAREKQAFDQLSNSIDNLGLSTSDYTDKIEEVISEQENLGRTSIQTQQALQVLVGSTHDPTEALNDMGEVSDLAASRQMSLSQAARQVAITIGGGGRLLHQYNIEVIKNADGTRNYAAMNAKLAEVLDGQASASVNNFSGHIRVLGVELEDTLAQFGQKYGAGITAVGFALFTFGTIAELVANRRVGKLVVATQAQTAAMEEQAGVTEATSADIITATEAQTAAILGLTEAYQAQATAAEAAGTAGVVGAEGAGAGAAMGGAVGGTAAATTAASEEIVAAEATMAESTSSLALFWEEQQAAMAADIEASKDVALIAWREEQAALLQFQTLFAEAYASMAAAADAGAADIVAANEAIVASEEEAAAGAGAAAAGGMFSMLGMLALLPEAFLVAAAAGGTFDIFTHKLSYDAAAAVPPMNSLSEAIKQNYGELNNAVTAIIDNNAAQNDLLPTLNTLGISTQEFNRAVKEGPDALEALGKRINMTTLSNSSLNDTFTVMGKSFDTHEQVLAMVQNSYSDYTNQLSDTIETSQKEADATAGLTDTQIEQAKALGISENEYASMLSSIDDSIAKKRTEEEQNWALIASDQSLQAVLSVTEDRYNQLTAGMLNTIHANQELNATQQGIADIHTFFDPVLQAYSTWQDSIDQLNQAETQQVQQEQAAADAVTKAKQQEADAEKSLVQTEKDGTAAIADAEDALAKARQDAAKKVVAAEQSIVDAEDRSKQATQQLRDARAQANDEIIKATRFLRDQAEEEQKARDALRAAELDQAQAAHDAAQDALNSSVGLTQQQLIDSQNKLNSEQDKINKARDKIAKDSANNAVTDAQTKLHDLLQDDVKARKDALKVIAEGIKQNPEVIKAEKAQKDAIDAVRQAKRDEIQAEKDAQKEISDAEAALTKARQKAAQDNAAAEQKVKDAQDAVTSSLQSQQTAEQNTTDAINTATQAVHDNRAKLTNLEIQTGQTDQSLQRLQTTMDTMDKRLTLRYQAKGTKDVGQSMVLLQRSIEETLLEAGGMTPAQARRQAQEDIPNFGEQPGSGNEPHPPGQTAGPGGPVIGPGFATGGAVRGDGNGTSDSIPALLSNNEHVWTAAEVQAAGGHDTVKALRQAAVEGMIGAFAGGGAVGPIVDSRRMDLIDRMKHSGMLSVLGRGFRGDSKYAGYMPESGWPNMAAVQSFIRSVDRLPYVYGATGPGAYDCSGLVGEVWARLTGHPSYNRYFSTSNEKGFFLPGEGLFTVGVTDSGGTHHTAGRLGNLKFEARDTAEGIIIGPSAQDPENFDWVGHLKERSGWATHAPGGGDGDVGLSGHLTPDQARLVSRNLMPASWPWAQLRNMWNQESGFQWDAFNPSGAYGIPQSLPGNKMASQGPDWHDNAVTQIKWGLNYIKDRYGSIEGAWGKGGSNYWGRGGWYDDGGMLQPGLNVVANSTGKPEPVLTNDQWSKLLDGLQNGMHIDNVTLSVDMSKIKDVNDLVEIFKQLPQAVRAMKGGSIRKVNV
jgi:hypothetical protein